MRDEDLAERLRAGMDADDPPAGLVSERVSSVRRRLDEGLSDRASRPADEDADVDDVPIVTVLPLGDRPAGNRRPWVRRGLAVAAVAAVIIGLVITVAGDDDGSQVAIQGSTEGAACMADLELTAPGVLTVATPPLSSPPWRIGEPSEQRGFEPALVHELAGRLGLAAEEIDWDQVGFQDGLSPREKNYDLFVDAVAITEERDATVDFTDPYYDVELAVIAFDESPLADATSISDLRDATLVAATTTNLTTPPGSSVEAARSAVTSPEQVVVFDTLFGDDLTDMLALMASGSADAMIVDLPSARFVLDALVAEGATGPVDASVVAVLPRDESFERLGMVLEDGSPLTRCVDLVLAELREDGTLADLETEWLREGGAVPTLTG